MRDQKPDGAERPVHTDAAGHLSCDTLRDFAPLLKVDAVKPGDVILTRGRGRRADLIATATRGEFSHASLWLPVLGFTGRPCLFEADGAGVGFTLLRQIYLTGPGLSSISTYRILHGPVAPKLLRHPRVGGLPARELVDAADRLFKKVLHHRYSALTRMVPAVNLPLRIEAIARTLARTVDRVTGVDEDDGFYCSELVRMFFAELGLDLFHGETGPACISPNALDSPSCLLDEVRDAFVVIDNIGSDIQGFESQCHIPGREQRLPPLVESQDRARHSANRMRTLFEKMRAMSERIDHLSETQGRTLYAQVAQSTERAFASGDDEVAARFGDYLVALHYINHVERQIHDYHRRMTASEAIPVESDAWSPAYVALTQTFVLSRLDLHLKYFRSHVTYTLQQIRRQCRLAGECWRGKRLERVRREFLEEWREARTGLRRVARSVAETKGIEALSPESMSYVDEVLEAAAVTAMQDCPMVWSGFGRRDPLRG